MRDIVLPVKSFPSTVDSARIAEQYLGKVGEVFAIFANQDSGCVSFGVEHGGDRWFVKTAFHAAGIASLRRAVAFHAAVRHRVITAPVDVWDLPHGLMLCYPWLAGVVLYHATVPRSVSRTDPASAIARFRALPLPEVLAALGEILDAHVVVENAGYVAVDFYDGSIMYDFDHNITSLIDLDEYLPGPFIVREQLSGSSRYMAHEESTIGATIDQRTMVFVMGRMLRLLMDSGDDESQFRGSPKQLTVIQRATSSEPADRFVSVKALRTAWDSFR